MAEQRPIQPKRRDQSCPPVPCGWIWTETEAPSRERFRLLHRGEPATLEEFSLTDELFVLRALATIQGEHPPGVESEPDPRYESCSEDCVCWQVEPNPGEGDWGPWQSVYVNVEVPVRGEQGSDTATVIGSVRKRKTRVAGVCSSKEG